METARTMDEFNDAVRTMERRFPGARTWLKWWTNVLHGVLIFPAMRSHILREDIEAFYRKPPTNNITEANNRATARFIDYNHLPVVLAVRKCFLWAQLELRQVQQITEGILHVGVIKKAKLLQSTGGAFRQASRFAARHEEYEDGNRAPVSTEDHSKTSSSQSALRLGCSKRAKVVIINPSGTSSEETGSEAALRDVLTNILFYGLPAGSVVQCRNELDSDKWL
jgi:hypothetical protein